MSKFGDDIRKISRYDELLRLIQQKSGSGSNPVVNGAIAGARGVAYGGNGGGTTTSPGGSSPNNNGGTTDTKVTKSDGTKEGESSAVDGATDAANAITTGSSSSDLDNPDNTSKDGYYDAKSLLDNTKDAFGKGATDGLINSITGLMTDDSARNLLVHLKDAALSFVPPDDWAGAFAGGADPTWSASYYYTASNFAGTLDGATFNLAGKAVADITNGYYISGIPATVTKVDIIGGTPNPVTGNGDYVIEYYYTTPGGTTTGPVTNNISITRHSCTSVGTPSIACQAVAPTATSWTDLGLTQLGFVTPLSPLLAPLNLSSVGKFIPNPYDVNVPTDFADGNSILDLKTVSGDNVRIGPLKDGGWYMYYSDGAGAPVGAGTDNTVFMVKNDRKPGGFITPNQLGKLKP